MKLEFIIAPNSVKLSLMCTFSPLLSVKSDIRTNLLLNKIPLFS